MTKNDNLFDIRYVVFDADEAQSLIGKNVFVSDSLINICDAVNEMRTDSPCYYGKLLSVKDYTLHVCFDMETVLEKDVCKDCRKRFMADMDAFFQVPSLSYHSNEKEEKHVGD